MSKAVVSISRLKCEYMSEPIGIDVLKPRLSWEIASSRRGMLQTAYQVIVAKTLETLDQLTDLVWDTGKVASAQSINCEYDGPALQSRQRYYWKVRVWDEKDNVTSWSESACWEMGLLDKRDWAAKWIEPQQKPTVKDGKRKFFEMFEGNREAENDYLRLQPCPLLRKEFKVSGDIKQARIYATAHGVYSLELNGKRVGNRELAPEVTAYQKYLQYQTYDVTEMIAAGDNALGVILADGWYAGRIGLSGDSCQYGDMLALLLQLEIDYADGKKEIIVSDGSFKSSTGPLVYSDIFIGERYDARQEKAGWSCAGYDDRGWTTANEVEYGYGNLVAQYGEPVRVMEIVKPVEIITTPKGETVIDFGQVLCGRVRMTANGAAGTEIVLEHSEVLDEYGNFMMNIMGRSKEQKDHYVLKGAGDEVYEPRFTFHGFRYVKVTGYQGDITADKFSAAVLYSGLESVGSFECSDQRLNQLQHNIVWSQKGNMLGIPTDCPQRERAGFTGDIQVYAPTACFNMDVAAFLINWLRNLALEQREDGAVPVMVPYFPAIEDLQASMGTHTSAGWGDACVIVPWALYQAYGDKRILEEMYPVMNRWLDYIIKDAAENIPENVAGEMTEERRRRHQYLWNTGFHFGDWLIPSLCDEKDGAMRGAFMTKELVSTCFYAYSTELAANIADLLGKAQDAKRYQEISGKVRQAFAEEYLGEDGTLTAHFQGIYVLALKMNLVPDHMRGKVLNQLVTLIEQNNNRLDTGFLSVPFLLDVLCDNGRRDVAYKLLYQTECPSWLYQVEKGATTMWERWAAIMPDGKVTGASFNHYAFGCVGDWLYRRIAGINAGQAGYKHIVIKPEPDEKLTYAKASYHSVYGEIISGWKVEDSVMTVKVTIPVNTTAEVWLPGAELGEVTEQGMSLNQCQRGISGRQQDENVLVALGSGNYSFQYPLKK
ncbi:MAG: alpha-L-rhamnosidase [Firmicutes bacterium]|nr:alpha-L-rhamnosidase [Bacillota bacterium]